MPDWTFQNDVQWVFDFCAEKPHCAAFDFRILAVCHGVMYKQLSAWMLYGLLLDQHEEFFIRQGPSSGNVPSQPEEDDDDLGIGGLTGKQLRELQDLVRLQVVAWHPSVPRAQKKKNTLSSASV